MKKYFLLPLLMFGLILTTACSGSEETEMQQSTEPGPDQTISQKVDFYINSDQYEQALELLDTQNENEETLQLKEKTHLNYGIYLIYNADPSTMRENANNALRQFVEVLEINPENEKAQSEIEQILSIYRSFPDREPAEDVLEDLRELGFDV